MRIARFRDAFLRREILGMGDTRASMQQQQPKQRDFVSETTPSPRLRSPPRLRRFVADRRRGPAHRLGPGRSIEVSNRLCLDSPPSLPQTQRNRNAAPGDVTE
jgi:hypothetical protein